MLLERGCGCHLVGAWLPVLLGPVLVFTGRTHVSTHTHTHTHTHTLGTDEPYHQSANEKMKRGVGGMGGALLNPAAVPKETERRSQITASGDALRGAKAPRMTLVRALTNVDDQA